ncbi:MAG: hypothetical protein ABI685_08730 [Ferruginibacter sp.]
MKTRFYYFIIFTFAACAIISCQKEINGLSNGGIIVPANQKPKVGTTWTYRHYTYYSYGSLATIKMVTHKAKSEEMLGGEKWLKIVDVETDTTVYFLNEKTAGLYQYANNSSNLLCKDPAAVNDSYTTFNEGAAEMFTVKGVNDTLATGVGDIPLNYYEGVKTALLIDLIWYNKYAWIVWKFQYIKTGPPGNRYWLYSKMYLDNIVY